MGSEMCIRDRKWFEHDQMMYEQGRKDEQENTEREKKRADAAEQQNELTKRLLADQRLTDLQRALDDPAFRDRLLQEYGI